MRRARGSPRSRRRPLPRGAPLAEIVRPPGTRAPILAGPARERRPLHPAAAADTAAGKSECYALVTIPPVMEKRTKQVCVKPESCTTRTIPAEYTTVSKQVCKQPETCREEIIPARYEDRTRQVEKTCGYYKDIPIPAVFETVSEQVCNNDGRWEWKLNTSCAVPMPAATNPCGDAAMPK